MKKTKILYIAEAHHGFYEFGPFFGDIVDTLKANPQYEIETIKANYSPLEAMTSKLPRALKEIHRIYRRYFHKKLISKKNAQIAKEFNPDIVFSINRFGLNSAFKNALKPDCKIITWYVDSPEKLAHNSHYDFNFSKRDYICLTGGLGPVQENFLKNFPQITQDRLKFFPFASNINEFYDQKLIRNKEIIFLGNIHIANTFSNLITFLSKKDKNALNIFLEVYKEHRKNYCKDINEKLKEKGFYWSHYQNEFRPKNISFNELCDAQIAAERRINALSALSDFDLHIYGNRHYNWIFNMSVINGDLLDKYKFNDKIESSFELAKLYNQSKIALNVQFYYYKNSGVSIRVFDIMACKALLLTQDDQKLPLEKIGFKENEDFITYDNAQELKEKCTYYLNNEEARLKIVNSAYQKMQKYHSIEKRVNDILEFIK